LLPVTPTPSPLPEQPAVDTSELFAVFVAFVVVLGLSLLLIARMRAANR
jgi:hypothetical protein